MFDIIQYLYDNFLVDDRYPDSESLSLKLSAAGFEQGEIEQALDWLDGLSTLDPQGEQGLAHAGLRHYSEAEMQRLTAEGRGFLIFLEQSGLLAPNAREWIIDRAMALDEPEVPTEKLKWIALLALWRLGGSFEALWLEDLVRSGEDDTPLTLH